LKTFANRLSSATPIWAVALVAGVLTDTVWVSGRQSPKPLSISVVDPRPVAKAVELLEARYGWAITYEDPPYEHDSEIEDVTISVRKDGKVEPRVIVPRAGLLNYTYNDVQTPADPTIILPVGDAMSWQLFYSPSLKAYFFNVHRVPEPAK
jgi:hypothetical protein